MKIYIVVLWQMLFITKSNHSKDLEIPVNYQLPKMTFNMTSTKRLELLQKIYIISVLWVPNGIKIFWKERWKTFWEKSLKIIRSVELITWSSYQMPFEHIQLRLARAREREKWERERVGEGVREMLEKERGER